MHTTAMVAIMAAASLTQRRDPVGVPQLKPHTRIGDPPSKHGNRLCQDMRHRPLHCLLAAGICPAARFKPRAPRAFVVVAAADETADGGLLVRVNPRAHVRHVLRGYGEIASLAHQGRRTRETASTIHPQPSLKSKTVPWVSIRRFPCSCESVEVSLLQRIVPQTRPPANALLGARPASNRNQRQRMWVFITWGCSRRGGAVDGGSIK